MVEDEGEEDTAAADAENREATADAESAMCRAIGGDAATLILAV